MCCLVPKKVCYNASLHIRGTEMDEGIGVVIAAIISGIVALFIGNKTGSMSKEREVKKIESSYRLPVQIPSKDKRNSILLVGLGGTGKTSLIKALLNNHEANPNEKTESFEIYKGDRLSIRNNQDSNTENNRYWFYIADYKGQNVGQLIRSFIVQQKKPYSPLAYGYVTSLILIVDLIAPKEEQDGEALKRRAEYDKSRVEEHLSQWNETALDSIFGLLTSELRYVSIFINKIDLMENRTHEYDEKLLSLFKPLEYKIRKRSGRATVKMYLGSAQTGAAINFLVEDIMEYSVYNSGDMYAE